MALLPSAPQSSLFSRTLSFSQTLLCRDFFVFSFNFRGHLSPSLLVLLLTSPRSRTLSLVPPGLAFSSVPFVFIDVRA